MRVEACILKLRRDMFIRIWVPKKLIIHMNTTFKKELNLERKYVNIAVNQAFKVIFISY
jgi:hypothetical protein